MLSGTNNIAVITQECVFTEHRTFSWYKFRIKHEPWMLHWAAWTEDRLIQCAFDLCGLVSFYLCKPQACTICLSRHSGLCKPYQLEHRIMVQKSSLFEIDKGRETVFPIKHLGLIWDARLERWSDSGYALKSTSGPRAILAVWLFRRE